MLCIVYRLGLMGYSQAYNLQKELLRQRANNEIADVLLLLEHPPTITIGQSGKLENVLASQAQLAKEGISLFFIDRGGDVTYHGPGQLVAYPIIDVSKQGGDFHQYVHDLEDVIIRTLSDFGINACRDKNHAGVWVKGEEIAAIGLRIKRWITTHGLAINVNTNLEHFALINPCGFTDRKATSMAKLLCQDIPMALVTDRLLVHFSQVFDAYLEWGSDILEEPFMKGRLPFWFSQKPADPEIMSTMERLLHRLSLHTICESSLCPNIGGCFSQKTATFLILGDVCTRHCAFCAVKKGRPHPVDKEEPQHLLEAVEKLDLGYIVITSVTNDDLVDGGASQFVKAINILHQNRDDALVEVLVPDFGGSAEAIKAVVDAHPEVVNHNLETVPRLYPAVRPEADYNRSLALLSMAKKLNPNLVTKSGLILGLGETKEEVVKVMEDLRGVNCDLLTIGQYLQPSPEHHPVVRFISPEEFSQYRDIGRDMGFVEVASAPLVRSSFKAAELYAKVKGNAYSLGSSSFV